MYMYLLLVVIDCSMGNFPNTTTVEVVYYCLPPATLSYISEQGTNTRMLMVIMPNYLTLSSFCLSYHNSDEGGQFAEECLITEQ